MQYSKPSTVICTVGTSLFMPNLERLKQKLPYQEVPSDHDHIGQAEKISLKKNELWQSESLHEILIAIRQFYQEQNWSQLAKQLLLLPPDIRLCGAEINSIESMIRKGFLAKDCERLVLLVSDTREGESIGSLLCSYFQDSQCSIGFKQTKYIPIDGLQDQNPQDFQRKGLTNLVRTLGEQLRSWGNESIAINATGGYKAQIALAVAFGQATHSPVFYKHERFDQIIRFPRIPFTLDLSLVADHVKLWADLAEPEPLPEEQIEYVLSGKSKVKESLLPMLDSIEERGKKFFGLSSLGMVYWQAYLFQHRNLSLEPADVIKRQGDHFSTHTYPNGFKEYVKRIYDAFPKKISECHSLPYDKQRGIQTNRFYSQGDKIIGEYVDRNNFGARFAVMTTARNELERKWVVDQLNRWTTDKIR